MTKQATVFCLGHRLSKHKMTGYARNLGGPLPLGYSYGVHLGVRINFSIEGKRRHFASPFQVADDGMQMDVHKTLTHSTQTTKKMPYVTATITNNAFP